MNSRSVVETTTPPKLIAMKQTMLLQAKEVVIIRTSCQRNGEVMENMTMTFKGMAMIHSRAVVVLLVL